MKAGKRIKAGTKNTAAECDVFMNEVSVLIALAN